MKQPVKLIKIGNSTGIVIPVYALNQFEKDSIKGEMEITTERIRIDLYGKKKISKDS